MELRNLIDAESRGGAELRDLLFEIARGDMDGLKIDQVGKIWVTKPTVGERLEALKVLLAYWAGKPAESSEVTIRQEGQAGILTEEQVRGLSEADTRELLANISGALARAGLGPAVGGASDPGEAPSVPAAQATVDVQPAHPNTPTT